MRGRIAALLDGALERAVADGAVDPGQLPRAWVQEAASACFGDFASDLAMVLARRERRPPDELGRLLVARLAASVDWFDAVEVAGPGYINFRCGAGFWRDLLREAQAAGEAFGRAPRTGERVALIGAATTDEPADAWTLRATAVEAALAAILRRRGAVVSDGVERHADAPPVRTIVVGRAGEGRSPRPCGTVAPEHLVVGAVRTRGHTVPSDHASAAMRLLMLSAPAEATLDVDTWECADIRVSNPLVSYAYALARIDRVPEDDGSADADAMAPPAVPLVRALVSLPDALRDAARDATPQPVAGYLNGLAAAFHRYYNRTRHASSRGGPVHDSKLMRSVSQTLRCAGALLGVAAGGA